MIEENTLTVDEYYELIDSVGWKRPSKRLLLNSLKNSYTVKYLLDDKVIGMARLVTDYGYSGLIMDVVVNPNFQGKGIGTILINKIIDEIKSNLEKDEEFMLQLLYSPGKKEFYEKFGFKEKKEYVESGMYKWVKKD